ncbi:hypothetical protein PLESTF_001572200 [Pleodorina starrii]|nr:hypothetical protein PLESTF_001572200 [Pleodorina starrii]
MMQVRRTERARKGEHRRQGCKLDTAIDPFSLNCYNYRIHPARETEGIPRFNAVNNPLTRSSAQDRSAERSQYHSTPMASTSNTQEAGPPGVETDRDPPPGVGMGRQGLAPRPTGDAEAQRGKEPPPPGTEEDVACNAGQGSQPPGAGLRAGPGRERDDAGAGTEAADLPGKRARLRAGEQGPGTGPYDDLLQRLRQGPAHPGGALGPAPAAEEGAEAFEQWMRGLPGKPGPAGAPAGWAPAAAEDDLTRVPPPLAGEAARPGVAGRETQRRIAYPVLGPARLPPLPPAIHPAQRPPPPSAALLQRRSASMPAGAPPPALHPWIQEPRGLEPEGMRAWQARRAYGPSAGGASSVGVDWPLEDPPADAWGSEEAWGPYDGPGGLPWPAGAAVGSERPPPLAGPLPVVEEANGRVVRLLARKAYQVREEPTARQLMEVTRETREIPHAHLLSTVQDSVLEYLYPYLDSARREERARGYASGTPPITQATQHLVRSARGSANQHARRLLEGLAGLIPEDPGVGKRLRQAWDVHVDGWAREMTELAADPEAGAIDADAIKVAIAEPLASRAPANALLALVEGLPKQQQQQQQPKPLRHRTAHVIEQFGDRVVARRLLTKPPTYEELAADRWPAVVYLHRLQREYLDTENGVSPAYKPQLSQQDLLAHAATLAAAAAAQTFANSTLRGPSPSPTPGPGQGRSDSAASGSASAAGTVASGPGAGAPYGSLGGSWAGESHGWGAPEVAGWGRGAMGQAGAGGGYAAGPRGGGYGGYGGRGGRGFGGRGGGRRGGGELDGNAGADLVSYGFMQQLRGLGVTTATPAAVRQVVKAHRHCVDALTHRGCNRAPGACQYRHDTPARLVAEWLGAHVGH